MCGWYSHQWLVWGSDRTDGEGGGSVSGVCMGKVWAELVMVVVFVWVVLVSQV